MSQPILMMTRTVSQVSAERMGLEQTLKLIGAFSFCGKSKKDDPAVFWLWDF